MNFLLKLLLSISILPITLLFSSDQTDYAIFIFDNMDKNMIASMFNYAEKQDASLLNELNFRIVFMGPSVDGMSKEPFCHYPEKLIHYSELGIEEIIDHTWKRDRLLNQTSIENISKNLAIQKKIWVGVSCSIFGQILQYYQDNTDLEVVALRDNPNLNGNTDYFLVANNIQSKAKKVAIPSKAASENLDLSLQKIVVIGHGPVEEWCEEVKNLDKEEIILRLGLNSQLPIILYAGVYGDYYENCFKTFLELVAGKEVQIVIAPHPRYKGVIEKQLCAYPTIGEWEADPKKNAKMIELLYIADAIVTADATSTIVFQGSALKKKVLYINPVVSQVSDDLCARKLIQKINSSEEFNLFIHTIKRSELASSDEDAFDLLGIPKNGAKLLWEELLR